VVTESGLVAMLPPEVGVTVPMPLLMLVEVASALVQVSSEPEPT
jgi:hypothetical protein